MGKTSNMNKKKNKKKVVDEKFNFDQDYFLGLSDTNNKNNKKNSNRNNKKNNNKSKVNKSTRSNKTNKGKNSKKDEDILRQKEILSKNIATGKIKNKKLVENERKKQRKKKIIKFVLLAFILIGTITFLLVSPVFNIETIEVRNNNKVSSDTIVSVSGIQKYKNIFLFSKSSADSKIRNSEPYVESTKIYRSFPNKVVIEVTERTATLQVEVDDTTYAYVNNQGYILEYSEEKLEAPVITSAETDFANLRAQDNTTRLCENDLSSLGNVLKVMSIMKDHEMDSYIVEFDISDIDDLQVKLDQNDKIVHLGNCTDLNTRILYLKEILKDTEGEKGEIFINGNLNEDYIYFREDV